VSPNGFVIFFIFYYAIMCQIGILQRVIVDVKNFNLVPVFVILFQFSFCLFLNWKNFIHSKLGPNLFI